MNSVMSIKARLKNYAKKGNRTFQDVLTMYVLERVIYRLSVSPFKDRFTLKGGILLYGMFDGDFTRATTDIDLLGEHINNDFLFLKDVFKTILTIPSDDPLRFDTKHLEAKPIAEFKEYPGTRVSSTAFLERTRIPVSIDIGFGDVIYPHREKMEYPSILGDSRPMVNVYSRESIIAEKMEAIASLGVVNSRFKDFYDISVLSEHDAFDFMSLRGAIQETFIHRHTDFNDIIAFQPGFVNEMKERQWKGFLRHKNVTDPRDLTEIIEEIKNFLLPVIASIRNNSTFDCKWDPKKACWSSGAIRSESKN